MLQTSFKIGCAVCCNCYPAVLSLAQSKHSIAEGKISRIGHISLYDLWMERWQVFLESRRLWYDTHFSHSTACCLDPPHCFAEQVMVRVRCFDYRLVVEE